MSILNQATPPKRKPPIITLYGPPGAGKTTLALTIAKGLKTFLIRTAGQDVPRDFPEDNLPVELGETDTSDKLWQQLDALMRDEHDFRAVVMDVVGGFENMFVQELLDKEPGRNINQVAGGYGAGKNVVAANHMRVRKMAEKIRERGVLVIFVVHSEVGRIEPPDSDAYTVSQLRLPLKSQAPYVDDVDLVGYLKLQTVLRGDGDGPKKAISSGDRVLITHLIPSATSKNRLGITEEIEIVPGVNPLAAFFKKRRVKPASAAVADEGDAHEPVEEGEVA